MRRKAWIAVAAAAVLGLSALCFTACGGDSGTTGGGGGTDGSVTTYNITMWVGEGTKDLTAQMVKDFNEAGSDVNGNVNFNATIEFQSESSAAGAAIQKAADCADVFCVAQDQLARLVHSNLTVAPNKNALELINNTMDSDSIKAATIGETVYAFPLTADNGYFMYYNKNLIPDSAGVDMTDLDAILDYCETNNYKFYMNLTESGCGWYGSSFFYATGCESEWITNDDGDFTNYNDTFNSDNGVIALQEMQRVIQSSAYIGSDADASRFALSNAAVVISGNWDYNTAEGYLGDNLGIAALPSWTTSDGKTYTLVAPIGRKLLCIKPQSDAQKLYGLQLLASYLTGETCQQERFNEVAWGPTIKSLQDTCKQQNLALQILADEATTPQGQYPTNWWSKMQTLQIGVRDDTTKTSDSLGQLLTTYSTSLNSLLVNGSDADT